VERTFGEVQNCRFKVVSRLGLEPRTLALKAQKDEFTQGLGFAKVSPFFLCEQGLEMTLYIPLIL
jgi:hypothetical protein